MTRGRALILLLVLPALGAAVGHWAGPLFATSHDRVRLAARVLLEDAEGLTERTEESEAFRVTGRPPADLFAEARGIERRFRLGTAILGAFLGLVVGLKFAGFALPVHERLYTIHQPDCVACGRCFLSCPREHVRLKELGRAPQP